MKHDEIDRILREEDLLLPSSGFVLSVMDAVRREASVPPPIPFPWKRAWPGILIAVALSLYGMFLLLVELRSVTQTQMHPQEWELAVASILNAVNNPEAGWIVLALFLSFVSAVLPGQLLPRKPSTPSTAPSRAQEKR